MRLAMMASALYKGKQYLNKTPVLIFQLKGGGERRGEPVATLGNVK